jgi:aryl-alcohol dehydrogenase-like predicted oxidoreductase
MEIRSFPQSDLQASVVGVGCNNFGMFIDEAATKDVVDAALGAGVTFFDTAAMYGGGKSEEFLGRSLGARRDQAVIATKFPSAAGEGSCAPAKIREECDASLARLGTDYIDLYQQHYPDPATSHADVLGTLAELVAEGKVRHVGHSNFTAPMHAEAQRAGEELGLCFVSSQVHWNLLERDIETEVVPAAATAGVGVLPYFPLASGLLTGKHQRGNLEAGSRLDKGGDYFAGVLTDDNFTRVDRLTTWGADHGRSLLEIAFQWLASQPTVTSVIAGATKPSQIVSNAAAVGQLLSSDELAEIEQLLTID